MDPVSTQDGSTGEARGIHVERVARFFRDNVPGGDVPLAFELLAGGRSNLTYRVRGGDRSWVLRRPPLGHVLPTAHDMSREYRVLDALADSDVPTPHVFALCEDASVNDAPFYVMDYRPGVVLDAEIPAGFADSAADRKRIGLALVDTLVRLDAVDYEAVGLAGFGRPAGTQTEVDRSPFSLLGEGVGPRLPLHLRGLPFGGRRGCLRIVFPLRLPIGIVRPRGSREAEADHRDCQRLSNGSTSHVSAPRFVFRVRFRH